jgi:hypothetical protein
MLEKTPTLLLDEAELFNGKNKSESTQTLLAVLNAGHRRGATIPKCEPPKNDVRHVALFLRDIARRRKEVDAMKRKERSCDRSS